MGEVHLFLGEDSFSKEEQLAVLKKSIGSDSGNLNYDLFFGDEIRAQEVLDCAKTHPFAGNKRLVVLKKAQALDAHDRQLLLEYSKSPAPFTTFVIFADVDKKDIFFGTLSRHTKAKVFSVQTDFIRLSRWIKEAFSAHGKTIYSDSIKLLIANLGYDLNSFKEARDKICLYAGQRKQILREDVTKLTGRSLEEDAFEVSKAVAARDVNKSLLIVRDILRDKKKAPEILGILGWHIKKYYKTQSRVLKEKLQLLLDADMLIKTGRIDPRLGLEALIIRLCKQTK